MTKSKSKRKQANAPIRPVILSGGAGTRLWPLSRALYPKQLLPLASAHSMIQDTVLRVADADRFGPPAVVCNEAHRFIIAEQLRQAETTAGAIIVEPDGRNTAPAAALAAAYLAARHEDPLLLVLPSDHVVGDEAAFLGAVDLAAAAAGAAGGSALVSFGVRPTTPETGYGYMKLGGAWPGCTGVHAVEAFVEKPDAETAAAFLASGNYVWNSGMFLFRAEAYLEELARLEPETAAACRAAVAAGSEDLDFFRPDAAAFAGARSASIDYAVMEHTDKAAAVPAEMGWSDVGAWAALWDLGDKDAAGNVLTGDVLAADVEGSYIRAEGRLVAAIGLRDMVLVVTDDAVLAAPRGRAQEVRDVVARLEAQGRPEAASHRTVYRPWGHYQTIDLGERFQAKRITVNPGGVLSLQKHAHRAEHWVVVRGTARVTRGDEVFDLGVDQSTYIPKGEVHRLENPGPEPVELIEVQSGDYLGEDDIVRLEDTYGRG